MNCRKNICRIPGSRSCPWDWKLSLIHICVGYGDYAAAVFFLKEVIDALCNGYSSEIVQGNEQIQIAAGTGDTGIADPVSYTHLNVYKRQTLIW